MKEPEFLFWDETDLPADKGLSVSLRIDGRPANVIRKIRVRDLTPLLDPDTRLPWERITADEWPVRVTALKVDLARMKAELRGVLVPEGE